MAGPGAYRTTDTCVTCGKAIDVKTAAYTADGMICVGCEAGALLKEGDREIASGSSSGFGALGWGVLSLLCNPFLIPSLLAIVGGLKELKSLELYEPAARSTRKTQAILGIVLGAVWPTFIVGAVGLAMTTAIFAPRPDYSQPYYDDPYYDDPYYDDYYADDPYLDESDPLALPPAEGAIGGEAPADLGPAEQAELEALMQEHERQNLEAAAAEAAAEAATE